MENLIDNFSELILKSIDSGLNENYAKCFSVRIKEVKSHVCGIFRRHNTIWKRNKLLKESENYVEPAEKAIALKWNTELNPDTNLPDHTITQATFHYVQIIKTLECLFSQANFKREYFGFNTSGTHVCQEGVYERYCCAETHKNSKFHDDRSAIKIRLFSDDCEICDALKSKKGIHKICCVYFTIDNMPEKFLSKTDNIFLVALCESTNLKIDDNNFDEIAELVLEEMKRLENIGIEVDGQTIKGSLARVVGDNLGANGMLGFVESFNSYFCRLCEISKEESERLLKERTEIMRTKASYQNCVEAASNFVDRGKSINLKTTKGIKRACIFNNLQGFHVLDNITLDVMHDVNEGIIPFFLTIFFEYCDSNKIVKKNDIQILVRDFNYGQLHKRNKPSTVIFTSPHLGQNATQLYTIMIHLPFIFANFKAKLEPIWISAESLLKMMQIIYSNKICEEDINNLTSNIEIHYTCLLETFGATLIPKHHFVLHYPYATRKIGPLINYWAMRFESKHRFFKSAAQRTNNFVNITKTLTNKHQEATSHRKFATDIVQFSKKTTEFNKCNHERDYSDQIAHFLNLDGLKVLRFAKYNSFDYSKGIMIISNGNLFEIDEVLTKDNKLFFFCCPYNVKQFDSFYNSVEIERKSDKISDFVVIEHRNLKNPKSYERKLSENKFFLICDTLQLKEIMN